MSVSVDGKSKCLVLTVVNEEGPTLLGRDWIRSLKLSVDEIMSNNSSIHHISHVDSNSLYFTENFLHFLMNHQWVTLKMCW